MNDSINSEKTNYATGGAGGVRGCLVAFDHQLRDAVQDLANACGLGLALYARAQAGASAMEICEWFKGLEKKFVEAAELVNQRLPMGAYYDRAYQVPESECFFFEWFPESREDEFGVFGAFHNEVLFVHPLVGKLLCEDVDLLLRAEAVRWVDAKEDGVLLQADWVVKHSPRSDCADVVEKIRRRGLAIQTAG
jgi:hypothetical protein